MSKYKRVWSSVEIHEKKKTKKNHDDLNPAYSNTAALMEKLGIKLNNAEPYGKQAASNINILKKKGKNINNNISSYNEDEDNSNIRTNNSVKKRNKNEKFDTRNENNKKKFHGNSSFDKRIVKKEQNKINDIPLSKKEKDTKSKKNIKDNNEANDNINIIRKRSIKSRTTYVKKDSETKNNRNNNNINSNKFKKLESLTQKSQSKGNKDEIKKRPTIKKGRNSSSKNIQNDIEDDDFNHNTKNYINEDDIIDEEETPKNKKSKKNKEDTTNNKKEKEKEKEMEIINEEKEKTKKTKNKSRSVGKELENDKSLIFKEKLDISKKKKNGKSENNSESEDEEEESDSGTSSSNSSKYSKNHNKNEETDIKTIIRSNKKHLTEMASHEQVIAIQRSSFKKNSNEEKEKNEESNNNEEPKIVSFNSNEKPKKNSVILGSKYLKRRSMDNPAMRERLENLMDEKTLRQNGGNTLFLKNYEKGPVYLKEFEYSIKSQNIKKNIKIGSCTKAGCSGPGIVKTNQDAYFIKENFLNNNDFFMGVCDGHGIKGELVSNYVTSKLPEYITELNNDLIINSFKKINSEVYSNKNMDTDMAGTTVVSLILTSEKMICANLGDSRAAIFKNENGLYYCKNLSRDHKPSEPDENRRIMLNNGRIKKCYDETTKKYIGPDRVWLKNKDEPGLAMSRSIGDKIAHSVGVSDEPELKSFEYDGTEKFIVLASDGIWEYIHGDECIKVLRPYYEEKKDVEEAAYALVKEAFRKWKRKEVAIDDITVIVVFFND